MAAASDLVHRGVAALEIEEELEEPPEEEELEEPPEQKKNSAAAALPLSPVPWQGTVAERYECHGKLGEGRFGYVYKAWDRVLERFVAVKRLSGRINDRFAKTTLPDFAREVLSLAACRGHPAVVHLLATHADCGRADGDCFVVTEYAGPMNLRQYMDVRRLNGQPFDEDEVRDVMEQLLAGVSHVHAAGVLHRDIVPENVIVDMDDTNDTTGSGRMVYKICGFGVSESAAEAEKDDSRLLASSNPYRAPELFLRSKDYDDRVDTWSLGCIMAELVTGDGVPFFGALDRDVLKRMLKVVGTKGIVKWQGRLKRVSPGEEVASLPKAGCLQTMFKLKVLSPAGFKVLKGLLHSNPDSRLSAAAVLRKPWFQRRSLRSAYCFMPPCAMVEPFVIKHTDSIVEGKEKKQS